MENNTTLALTLRSLLANNVVAFTFCKVNGEIRHAVGTRSLSLAESHLGISIPRPKGEEKPTAYYDLEKQGWRSYRAEYLISIDKVYPKTDAPKAEPKVASPTIPTDAPTDAVSGINRLIGGLFGGGGMGMPTMGTMGSEPAKPTASPHVPTIPTDGDAVCVGMRAEDFAHLVAKFVVDELVDRLK